MRLGSCPSAFGSVQVDLHYRTKMELSLPHPDEEHQHDLSHDEPRQGGIFVKASIPIRKSTELKRRLVLSNESKPKAKNWFSPLAEELPFTGDMSRCRNASQSSQGSDLYIPAIYSNLSAELLAAMPEDIKAPKVSESDGTPKSSEVSFFKFTAIQCLLCTLIFLLLATKKRLPLLFSRHDSRI